MVKPYIEKKIGANIYERLFESSLEHDDLLWHFDEEDRIIECNTSTDWQFQFDNKFPEIINDSIFIPKGMYHRLIKGTGDLTLIIKKL